MDFSEQAEPRYSRNILLENIGREGQRKISAARVLVIGSGGLGSAALLYLAAAGVGTIGIVDGDSVELSNLQRQVIHFTEDIGKPKSQSAKEKIHRLNPHIQIHAFHEYLDQENMEARIRDYDFIVDGTDNFASKFLINDICVAAGKPFCHTGAAGFAGQMMTVVPGRSACLRCVLPEPPAPDVSPESSRIGVLGALVGMLGSLQAAEAIKYIVGMGDLLTDRLLLCDLSEMIFREVKIKKKPKCRACG